MKTSLPAGFFRRRPDEPPPLGDGPEYGETPAVLVARAVLRWYYRAVGVLPPKRHIVLVLGSYREKLKALDRLCKAHGAQAALLPPQLAVRGADAVADVCDGHGFAIEHVIPLVDAVVGVADSLNSRLGAPANDPATSSCRRDKFEQQEALRRAGLNAPDQCMTAEVERAVQFAAAHKQVVVKPRDSSGNDGIWLCSTEADVRAAFAAELGRCNAEGSVNAELLVMEALVGEEWVVNSVSRDGEHRVTDVWRGPPKVCLSAEEGPAQFLYNVQFLAQGGCPRLLAVVDFARSVLDAVGLRNGAAHTELVWVGRPLLFEVNARLAGGLPRTPRRPNQLEALAMSFFEPDRFRALPAIPAAGAGAAVVFLRAPRDGWLTERGLSAMAALPTFARFERGLYGVCPPYRPRPVHKTTSLCSSPGAVVLQGEPAAVEEDVEAVRRLEEFAYVESLET